VSVDVFKEMYFAVLLDDIQPPVSKILVEQSCEVCEKESNTMKSAETRKPRRRFFNKLSDAKRGRKSRAIQAKAIDKVRDVNRDNTFAKWVAGVKLIAKRGSHRGATLASWIRDAC